MLFLAALGAGYPKPAAVPTRWELEFESGPLRLYVDRESGQSYWYFTYLVANRTGKVQLWAPSFTLYTDEGEIITSGRNVPTQVTQDLLDLLGNRLMEDQNQIIGDLLVGRENAKEGLVVWAAGSTSVNQLTLFVAGISGETARVKHPTSRTEIILRKSLQREYLIPGDALARRNEPIELVEETWVMR